MKITISETYSFPNPFTETVTVESTRKEDAEGMVDLMYRAGVAMGYSPVVVAEQMQGHADMELSVLRPETEEARND